MKLPAARFDLPKQRYIEIVDALRQAAIATDLDGRVQLWNKSAERLYGWKRSEVIGRDVVDVTPAEMSRADAANIMRTLAAGRLWSGEFPVRAKNGRAFVASVTDIPLMSAEGKLEGIMGVSAPSKVSQSFRRVVANFVDAATKVWPGRIQSDVDVPRSARVRASEPHVLQLLSLLLIRYADALDRGAKAEIEATRAEGSLFTDFGLTPSDPSVYVRVALRGAARLPSLVRDALQAAAPDDYAAQLVRVVAGMLLRESTPDATHLILALRSE